jgi:hypothetical protein
MIWNMVNVKQKYSRSSLNKGQLAVLVLVYRYRFVSRYLIADSLGIKPENGLYEKLEVLVRHDYLGKRFDKRLKLQAVPAAYYLAPKGYKALQVVPGYEVITEATIKASYKDRTVSQAFITHMLDVYKYTNLLKRHYSELKVFTKRDMSQYDYFPSQPPDAFLSLLTDNPQQPKRFFFDLVPDSTPRYILDRRIAAYSQFFDEGGWEVTGSELPAILLVCESGTAERRIQRNTRLQLSKSDMEELAVYTSTVSALKNMTDQTAVWTSVEDNDSLLKLGAL